MNGKGHSFAVLSLEGKRTDYDWCGSIAQAMKCREERIASGQYRCVFVQRLQVIKTRRSSSRRIHHISAPIAIWRKPAPVPFAKAA